MPSRWIAHRGGAGLRMENTLAAFANAIELGADGAELDVHLSRDGEVVVHHDDCLNPAWCRHPGGDWIGADEARLLASLRYAEIVRYDISEPRPGSNYARRHEHLQVVPGQRIPLLREVIQLARDRSRDFLLVIEIKASMLDAASRPWVGLVEAVLALLDETGFADRAVLCSFDWGALRHARERRPELPTWFTSYPMSWFRDGELPSGDLRPDAAESKALRAFAGREAPWYAGFDPSRFGDSLPRAVAAAGGHAWFPWHRDFSIDTAHELTALGLDSAVWTSNLRDRGELSRLMRSGACELVLDFPPTAMP